jgi:putative addiction module component (TIGR02574 family)
MTQIAERLKSELSQLSSAERAEIAHYLIESLDDGSDEDADKAWDAELLRRMDEIEHGTARGESDEAVIEALRSRYL